MSKLRIRQPEPARRCRAVGRKGVAALGVAVKEFSNETRARGKEETASVARESAGAVRDWMESAPTKPLLAFIGGGMQRWTRCWSNFESVHRLVLVPDDGCSGLGGARCAA
jgi:hypothetical protein